MPRPASRAGSKSSGCPMTYDIPPGGTTRPNGRVVQGWPPLAGSGSVPPAVDLTFDYDALPSLRTEVRACAIHCGFSDERATDIVIAVHELAANAVRHGGGTGRLRVWRLVRALQCQVDDGDLARSSEEGTTSSPVSVDSLPCEPGHGLSVAQQVADQMQSLSGPGGTSVMITFDLSHVRPGTPE